jgi:hypothetical protein
MNDPFKSFEELLADTTTVKDADILVRSAWSQYLSDGTQASLKRYERCKEHLAKLKGPKIVE